MTAAYRTDPDAAPLVELSAFEQEAEAEYAIYAEALPLYEAYVMAPFGALKDDARKAFKNACAKPEYSEERFYSQHAYLGTGTIVRLREALSKIEAGATEALTMTALRDARRDALLTRFLVEGIESEARAALKWRP